MTDIATQHTKIIEYLKQGYTMTGFDGLRVAGSMKLATRIGELIKKGYPIIKDWYYPKKGRRVRSYRLAKA